MAIYGTEWSTPFQTFVGVVNRIMVTAGFKSRECEDHEYYGSDAAKKTASAFKRRERQDSVLYKGYDDNDAIDREVAIAIDQLETKCREEIKISSSLLYGVQKYISKATRSE